MPVSPARAAAFDILLRVERESSYASELLHSANYRTLSAPDHALATELVMGVLRWRSRLDAELQTVSSQAVFKLDVEVLIALRLALYQFRWLHRIPHRAALYESVELVKRARKRSAAAFVNGVLRKLSQRQPDAASSTTEVCRDPSRSTVSSVLELSDSEAHPLWIVERWAKEYGVTVAYQICRHNQSHPVTAIRLRTPTAEAELLSDGISLTRGSLLSSARLIEKGDVTKTQSFRDRYIVIQDEASQLIAALVGSQEEKRLHILDCCAAPGGKTLAIADQNPSATVMATEIHPHRARLLKRLLRGLDSGSEWRIHVLAADARQLPCTFQFDRILADVPCSGTGTLARNPEIKWRLTEEDLNELQKRQIAILTSALSRLAPGGRLVYSTCSLEREENEDVVEQVLQEHKSFYLVDCRTELEHLLSRDDLICSDIAMLTRGPYVRTIPGQLPCDGFFAAILARK